ncbi:MAG: transcriptional repressor LexA [Candidatus Omnitrophica bacterium]|nr:transcriptional repressor LexA [Candidatus Omnitrophota bacterium]
MSQKQKLTSRQEEVLGLIRKHLKRVGAPPTIRELREGLKLKSLRGVTIHLDALEEKGAISRSRFARGIRVLEGGSPEGELIEVPVVGRIAAGAPILAEQNIEERLQVDPRLVPAPGCFAVRVHGESMHNAGIMDGDYVIVRPTPTAENGQIVAVLIEGEATVKRFYQEKGRIRLQPENPAIEPIFLHPTGNPSIRIMGRVVGLFRRF